MEWNDRIRCGNCRALNEVGRHFCSVCGAPLPQKDDGDGGSIVRKLTHGFGILVLAVALIAVAYGVYYAADRYLLPALGPETVDVETVDSTVVTGVSTTVTTDRLREDRVLAGGKNRYETAVAITELGFPQGAPALVLVVGDDYEEAVCAAPLAVAYSGALLLVPPEGLTDALSKEIERLAPTQVFLVGISQLRTITREVEEVLEAPEVTVLSGDDRYETAALVAEAVAEKTGAVEKVVVVSDEGFLDALTVGTLAAAKGWPILFTREDRGAPRATTNVIDDLGVTSALVVGTEVELELDDVDTKMGDNSDETAALVVAYALTQGLSFRHTVIATGDAFPDALVATPYVALDKGMLVLVKGGELPVASRTLLESKLSTVRTLDFIAVPGLAKEMAD